MPAVVSVVLTTYNHAAYIAEALDSVLAQETRFPVEILVTEDCSTDSTRATIERYATQYPDRIQLLLSPTNLNTNEVFHRALRASTAEFVATIDGDDFWTTPDKLQRQVDFMAANPSLAICFHQVNVLHASGSYDPTPYTAADQAQFSTGDALWSANFIASCSAVIRRSAILTLPPWYNDAFFGDWPLYILAAETGPIGYIPEAMATYRHHGAGVWTRMSRFEQLEATRMFLEQMHGNFRRKHRQHIRRVAGGLVGRLMAEHRRDGFPDRARRLLRNRFNLRAVVEDAGLRGALALYRGSPPTRP